MRFSDISETNVPGYYNSFREYCQIDTNANFESNAVISNFFGDHRSAIAFATKRATSASNTQTSMEVSAEEAARLRKHCEAILSNPEAGQDAHIQARKMLSLLDAKTDLQEVFRDRSPRNARDFIIEQAKRYHFLLINEAHYSSQNRAFTRSLLRPLWEQGYRYLALEALGYPDTSLAQRGYPLVTTGYYIQDPVFGNLVREALALGFRLVVYETTQDHDGTLRDRDQAWNIYRNTWQKDTVGKVLIHAGYGHIEEFGTSRWKPMGAQLKELANQDVLTVDQQRMTQLTDVQKLHPYYQYAINHFPLTEPVVLTDANDQVLIDPMYSLVVDVQVYHPATTYVQGRPGWLRTSGTRLVELPEVFGRYAGSLLQATPQEEKANTVPVDQLVLGRANALVLPPGEYELRIIDCEGTLRGKAQLRLK